MATIRKSSGHGDFTLFYGIDSPFSNFHPCAFKATTPDGNENHFNCSEQYFMHAKALLFADKDIAAKILAETDPKRMKSLGREVKGFDNDSWEKASTGVMEKALKAKFSQDPKLRFTLLVTKGSKLVECAPRDRLWGIGLGKMNPDAVNPSKWRGKNRLGKILDKVRGEMWDDQSSMDDRIKIEENFAQNPRYGSKYFENLHSKDRTVASTSRASTRPSTTGVPRFYNNNKRKPLIICKRNEEEEEE